MSSSRPVEEVIDHVQHQLTPAERAELAELRAQIACHPTWLWTSRRVTKLLDIIARLS